MGPTTLYQRAAEIAAALFQEGVRPRPIDGLASALLRLGYRDWALDTWRFERIRDALRDEHGRHAGVMRVMRDGRPE